VITCSVCGAANEEAARFCSSCGTALEESSAEPQDEVRKVVTTLFADVAGSTAVGERLDPSRSEGS
jgi:class 3 adenylate cyclase